MKIQKTPSHGERLEINVLTIGRMLQSVHGKEWRPTRMRLRETEEPPSLPLRPPPPPRPDQRRQATRSLQVGDHTACARSVTV